MRKISKFYLLPAALAASVCLVVGPGRAQDKPVLKMTVSMSTSLPPLADVLSPGGKFDESAAKGLVGLPEADAPWHKIPAWYSGNWQTDQSTMILNRNDQDGAEDTTSHTSAFQYHHLSGSYTDKTGQAWECDKPGKWTEAEQEESTNHTLMLTLNHTADTDAVVAFRAHIVTVAVDKKTGLIISSFQATIEEVVRPTGKDTFRTDRIERKFDWQGRPTQTTECILDARRIDGLTNRSGLVDGDGNLLFPQFVKFLKDNGMADRIPDMPAAASDAQ